MPEQERSFHSRAGRRAGHHAAQRCPGARTRRHAQAATRSPDAASAAAVRPGHTHGAAAPAHVLGGMQAANVVPAQRHHVCHHRAVQRGRHPSQRRSEVPRTHTGWRAGVLAIETVPWGHDGPAAREAASPTASWHSALRSAATYPVVSSASSAACHETRKGRGQGGRTEGNVAGERSLAKQRRKHMGARRHARRRHWHFPIETERVSCVVRVSRQRQTRTGQDVEAPRPVHPGARWHPPPPGRLFEPPRRRAA
jgi:hypothetical protein